MLMLLWLCFTAGAAESPVAAGAVFLLLSLTSVWSWLTLASVCRRDLDRVPQLTLPLTEAAAGVLLCWWVALPALAVCVGIQIVEHWGQRWGIRLRQFVDQELATTRIHLRPGDAAGYHALCRILTDQGRPRQAAEVLQRWLRHHPDDQAVRRQMELLRAQGQAADSRLLARLQL